MLWLTVVMKTYQKYMRFRPDWTVLITERIFPYAFFTKLTQTNAISINFQSSDDKILRDLCCFKVLLNFFKY